LGRNNIQIIPPTTNNVLVSFLFNAYHSKIELIIKGITANNRFQSRYRKYLESKAKYLTMFSITASESIMSICLGMKNLFKIMTAS
jgi:hypothetical protein